MSESGAGVSDGSLRTRPRFAHAGAGAGHYESFYLKACHPDGGRAAWIRYTTHQAPGGAPSGAVWLTLFDVEEPAPWAVKETLPAPTAPSGAYVAIGDSYLRPGRATGSADAGGRSASWELDFASDEPAAHHLPHRRLYAARLPRTKSLTPYPSARFSGSITAGGRTVDLDGWRGMVGHNWGSEHAERWIWLHADQGGGTWLDLALGRVRVGGVLLPWLATGLLSLDGRRHRLGGLGRKARAQVRADPAGAALAVHGAGLRVEATVDPPAHARVAWRYASPAGDERETVNCSVADLRLVVDGGGGRREIAIQGTAAYELGSAEPQQQVALQASPDG